MTGTQVFGIFKNVYSNGKKQVILKLLIKD